MASPCGWCDCNININDRLGLASEQQTINWKRYTREWVRLNGIEQLCRANCFDDLFSVEAKATSLAAFSAIRDESVFAVKTNPEKSYANSLMSRGHGGNFKPGVYVFLQKEFYGIALVRLSQKLTNSCHWLRFMLPMQSSTKMEQINCVSSEEKSICYSLHVCSIVSPNTPDHENAAGDFGVALAADNDVLDDDDDNLAANNDLPFPRAVVNDEEINYDERYGAGLGADWQPIGEFYYFFEYFN